MEEMKLRRQHALSLQIHGEILKGESRWKLFWEGCIQEQITAIKPLQHEKIIHGSHERLSVCFTPICIRLVFTLKIKLAGAQPVVCYGI